MTDSRQRNSESTAPRYQGALAAAAAPVAPLYIAPGNCEQLIGHKPRWVKETAVKLGVPILRPPDSRKWLINAAQFMAAIERAGLVREPEVPHVPEPGSAEELEQMRASLGLRLVGGAR